MGIGSVGKAKSVGAFSPFQTDPIQPRAHGLINPARQVAQPQCNYALRRPIQVSTTRNLLLQNHLRPRSSLPGRHKFIFAFTLKFGPTAAAQNSSKTAEIMGFLLGSMKFCETGPLLGGVQLRTVIHAESACFKASSWPPSRARKQV
jgi:hypothetical protein